VTGAYRYRPHSCFLHAYHVARTGSPLYVHLHWLHWGALAATGRGEIPEQVIDARTGKIVRTIYSPVKIRLEGPRSVCGHLIFTEHTVDFLEHEFTAHGESDRLPEPGRGCRPGARSAGLSPAAR
jgi:hypothetical protein